MIALHLPGTEYESSKRCRSTFLRCPDQQDSARRQVIDILKLASAAIDAMNAPV